MAQARKPAGKALTTTKKNLPAVAKPMGRGFEEADAESFAIPFLAVLQKSSPQADPDDAAYIKGAKAGMFINTVTLDLFEEVEIIPCAFRRQFNRWAPRDAGGGFKGMFKPALIAPMEAEGKIVPDEDGRLYFPMPDGSINEKRCDILTDTRMHFCLLVTDDGEPQPVLISLSRTQLKKSKQWMTLMQQRGGDMYGAVYKCSTKMEENDKGKWHGWVISAERETTEEEQLTASNFYESVVSGNVQIKMDDSARD